MTTEPAKKLSTRCEYNQHGQCAYAGECECDCHRTSTTEHEPAARGEGERWRVAQRYDGLVLIVRDDSNNQETPLLTLGKSDDDYVMANRIVTEHNSHTALVEQRDRALADVQFFSERLETQAGVIARMVGEHNQQQDQFHALKTARREEQRLHEEMTWAAQAMVDAVLQGNPGREMITKLAEDLSKRLNGYYRAKNEANAVEHEQGGGA